MAVLLAVITVLALGGCFKKSMSPGAGAAETTAANATEAVREEAAPLHTETEKEDETAPAAEENEERAADGPGADAEDAAESGPEFRILRPLRRGFRKQWRTGIWKRWQISRHFR